VVSLPNHQAGRSEVFLQSASAALCADGRAAMRSLSLTIRLTFKNRFNLSWNFRRGAPTCQGAFRYNKTGDCSAADSQPTMCTPGKHCDGHWHRGTNTFLTSSIALLLSFSIKLSVPSVAFLRVLCVKFGQSTQQSGDRNQKCMCGANILMPSGAGRVAMLRGWNSRRHGSSFRYCEFG